MGHEVTSGRAEAVPIRANPRFEGKRLHPPAWSLPHVNHIAHAAKARDW
jgi:hypothetical protein